jgi:hypothetical protein
MNPRLKLLLPILCLLVQSCSSAPKVHNEVQVVAPSEDPVWRESMDKSFRTREDSFRTCYENLVNRKPQESTVHFVPELNIGSTGKVLWSRVHETTTKDPSFQACMLTIINQTHFKPHREKEPITVRYPFQFDKKRM